MRITDAVIAGTLFETLWDILSSRVALMMYFILLFASIAGMIVAVMKLTTEQSAKQASDGTGAGDGTEDGDTGLKAEAADGAEGGMLELIDDDDITSRFHTLIQYDRAALRYVPPKHDDAITLPMICRNFRNYAACRLGLFYSEEDVRKFVAGLGVSHLSFGSETGELAPLERLAELFTDPAFIGRVKKRLEQEPSLRLVRLLVSPPLLSLLACLRI